MNSDILALPFTKDIFSNHLIFFKVPFYLFLIFYTFTLYKNKTRFVDEDIKLKAFLNLHIMARF